MFFIFVYKPAKDMVYCYSRLKLTIGEDQFDILSIEASARCVASKHATRLSSWYIETTVCW